MRTKWIIAIALMSAPIIILATAPSNSLQLTITAPAGIVHLSALQITATLTNVSSQNVKATQLLGDANVAYIFLVRDVKHNSTVPTREHIPIDENQNQVTENDAVPTTLTPGQNFTERIDLSKSYDLQPGTYAIRAERYMPKELGFSYLISPEIKVEVQ